MNEPVKPWVRSIAYHTYWNSPREPDTFYQVDTEQDAETLVALKLAVRESPPVKATRVVRESMGLSGNVVVPSQTRSRK